MARDTNDEVAETETRATDTNAKLAVAEPRLAETETRPTDMNAEVAETEIRPGLAWDDEVRGLCVRVYGDGAKSFIFVYCIGDRQRFIRIGQTPVWALEAARNRAKELRSIVEQGCDPAREYRGCEIPPVESIIQFIAEHLRTKP